MFFLKPRLFTDYASNKKYRLSLSLITQAFSRSGTEADDIERAVNNVEKTCKDVKPRHKSIHSRTRIVDNSFCSSRNQVNVS